MNKPRWNPDLRAGDDSAARGNASGSSTTIVVLSVLAGMLALLVLGGGGLAFWQMSRWRQEALDREKAAIAKLEEAMAAQARAAEQDRLAAEQAKATAERQAQAALDAITKIAQAEMDEREKTAELSRQLLGAARETLGAAFNETSVPEASFLEAQIQSADLAMKLGDLQGAVKQLDATRAAAEKAITENPDDLDAKRSLAKCWTRIGEIHRLGGRMAEATQSIEYAISLLTALPDDYPGKATELSAATKALAGVKTP